MYKGEEEEPLDETTPDGARSAFRRRLRAFGSSFLPALALFLWVRTYVVEPFYIPSVSMFPTLTVNDQIAVEKFSKLVADPRRGDLVVFSPPKEFYQVKGLVKAQRATLIKRVVAVGGGAPARRLDRARLHEPAGRRRREPTDLVLGSSLDPKLILKILKLKR